MPPRRELWQPRVFHIGLNGVSLAHPLVNTDKSDPFGLLKREIEAGIRVERVVGTGGFGTVYQAEHATFKTKVAIKVLRLPSHLSEEAHRHLRRKFEAEAQILSWLSSLTLNVPRPLSAKIWVTRTGDIAPYIIQEWLDGEALDSTIDRARESEGRGFNFEQIFDLLDPVVDALRLAHRRVVHRDIKPSNIFSTRVEGQTRTKLLDFGISKLIGEGLASVGVTSVTNHELKAFTPAYAAPEQWDPSLGEPTAQTDIFSFALVVLELLTLQPALAGTTPQHLIFSCTQAAERSLPSRLGLRVPESVDSFFAKALAYHPSQRPRSIEAWWIAIKEAVASDAPPALSARWGTGSALAIATTDAAPADGQVRAEPDDVAGGRAVPQSPATEKGPEPREGTSIEPSSPSRPDVPGSTEQDDAIAGQQRSTMTTLMGLDVRAVAWQVAIEPPRGHYGPSGAAVAPPLPDTVEPATTEPEPSTAGRDTTGAPRLPAETAEPLAEAVMPSTRTVGPKNTPHAAHESETEAEAEPLEEKGTSRRWLWPLLMAVGVGVGVLSVALPTLQSQPSAPEVPNQAPAGSEVEMAELTVRPSPSDASVYLDNELMAGNPPKLELRRGSEHQLRIELAGYETVHRTVQMKTNTTLEIKLKARPTEAAVEPPPTAAKTKPKRRIAPRRRAVAPPAAAPSAKVVAPPRPAAEPKAPKGDPCKPPFFFDKGIKTFKPECI